MKSSMSTIAPSRRLLLAGVGAAAAWPWLAQAQPEGAPPGPPPGAAPGGPPPGGPRPPPGPPPTPEQIAAALPLKTTGLEHVSMQIPDVAAAGLFFGKLFNPNLRQERAPPLRYYVPLKVGYIAIGAARDRPVMIDHYCALVEGYNRGAMAERLKAENIGAGGRFGMIPDPDGLQLQLLAVPGGWAPTIIDAPRIVPEEPFVQPIALDSVMIRVSDLERAVGWYQKFFPGKLTRVGSDRAWIQIENTRIGLVKAATGETPQIASFCVNVAKFDHKAVAGKLKGIGAEIIATRGDERDILRFKSPMGITVDIKEAKA